MITIYTVPRCEGCRHAIALAKFRRFEHEVIEIQNEKDVEELHKRLGKPRNITVPFVIVNENGEETAVAASLPEFRQWAKSQP